MTTSSYRQFPTEENWGFVPQPSGEKGPSVPLSCCCGRGPPPGFPGRGWARQARPPRITEAPLCTSNCSIYWGGGGGVNQIFLYFRKKSRAQKYESRSEGQYLHGKYVVLLPKSRPSDWKQTPGCHLLLNHGGMPAHGCSSGQRRGLVGDPTLIAGLQGQTRRKERL